VIAVLISLWLEGRRRKREQQIQIMRALLSTRHLAADPAYTVAINMIPVEFNGNRRIMEAWRTYLDAVRYRPSPENAESHLKDVFAKQTKLIFEIMRDLGFELPETDIQNLAYAAGGFIERDNITLEAWRAWPRIAAALEAQTKFLTASARPKSEGQLK
jgi:hypothetical protein